MFRNAIVLFTLCALISACGTSPAHSPRGQTAPQPVRIREASVLKVTMQDLRDLKPLVGKKVQLRILNPQIVNYSTVNMNGDGVFLRDAEGTQVPVRNAQVLRQEITGFLATVVRTAVIDGTITVRRSVTTRQDQYFLEIQDHRFESGED